MSTKALNWAFEQQGLNTTVKFVLVAMGDAAGDTGKSFSANKTICRMTGLLKEETISECQAKLCEIGLIKDTGQRTGATGKIKVFQFPEEACKLKTIESPAGRGIGNPPPDGALANSIPRESPANPPFGDGSLITKERGTGSEDASLPLEAVFWNANCGCLPKVAAWSNKRQKFLSQRRKDKFWVDNYKGAILLAAKSTFLTGGNDRGWKADFSWLIERPDAVLGIIEGKYGNKGSGQANGVQKPIRLGGCNL